MYAQHFGLERRPFRANALGNEVFVGPQTIAAMAGLKKSLMSSDAIVAVSGPVGSGKTTLVLRALESIDSDLQVISIARMRLRSDDVLDFLLSELGVENPPRGAIQRFSALRQRLQVMQSAGENVVIVVEDCARLGVEAVAELEALTAADTGVSDGAALILMGDERLAEVLEDPDLIRARQRIHQHYTTAALQAAELRGYLGHCFRAVGGNFDKLFEANAAPLLHHLSGGIPRVVNKLTDAALTAAAEQGSNQVESSLIVAIANSEFGLDASDFDLDARPQVAAVIEPEPEPKPEPEPEPDLEETKSSVDEMSGEEFSFDDEPSAPAEAQLVVEADPMQAEAATLPEVSPATFDLPVEAGFATIGEAVEEKSPAVEVPLDESFEEPLVESVEESPEESPEESLEESFEVDLAALEAEEPVAVAAEVEQDQSIVDEPAQTPEQHVDLPELELPAEPVAEIDSAPQIVFEQPVAEADVIDTPAATEVPELIQDTLPDLEILAPELAGLDAEPSTPVPEWDKDPTLAELRPDMAALEEALATSQSSEKNDTAAEDKADKNVVDDIPNLIPEITLDHAINHKVANNLIDEPGAISAAEPVANTADSQSSPSAPPIKLPPRQGKKADNEIDNIANELARAKSLEDVDELAAETLFGEELSLAAAQFAKKPDNDDSAGDPVENQVAPGKVVPNGSGLGKTNVEVTLEGSSTQEEGGMDISASQRLKTVRALNADLHPSLREPNSAAANDAPSTPLEAPEPIEDQINISMTQTLKALNVRPPVTTSDFNDDDAEDDDDEQVKNGFFSRFKRS